ncbi:hypothetical protein GCM10028816_36650 [Spirosoma lituiforme]
MPGGHRERLDLYDHRAFGFFVLEVFGRSSEEPWHGSSLLLPGLHFKNLVCRYSVTDNTSVKSVSVVADKSGLNGTFARYALFY